MLIDQPTVRAHAGSVRESRRLTDALPDAGDGVVALTTDVTDRQQVEAAVDAARERCARVEVLVNMAGAFRSASLANVGDADAELVFSSHVTGTLNTMRAVLPAMQQQQCGRIVNTSSIVVRGAYGGAVYGAAKGAIEAMTRSAAVEVARFGITANCVAPGYIDAGMFTRMPTAFTDPAAKAVPVGRAGTADEIAACVAFLASRDASYVTGQVLTACGRASLLN